MKKGKGLDQFIEDCIEDANVLNSIGAPNSPPEHRHQIMLVVNDKFTAFAQALQNELDERLGK